MNKTSLIIDEIATRVSLPAKDPCRLFHGRGGTLSEYEFLIIDWYPPVALITLHETREQDWLMALAVQLQKLLGDTLQGIVVQDRSNKTEVPMQLLGPVPKQLVINEAGCNYRIEPTARQNIGFFIDMRPGRKLVNNISRNKKTLNLFAYTCAFSVAAIAGGASQVVNLDMNRNLLERGKENHRLNDHDLRKVSFIAYNLFKSFGKLRQLGPFDLIIIDPPYHQAGSFRAERDWSKIIKRLPSLLTPNGEVVAAVSAPELGRKFLLDQFRTNLPQAKLLQEITADADFPEVDPDKGLHIQHYRLEGA